MRDTYKWHRTSTWLQRQTVSQMSALSASSLYSMLLLADNAWHLQMTPYKHMVTKTDSVTDVSSVSIITVQHAAARWQCVTPTNDTVQAHGYKDRQCHRCQHCQRHHCTACCCSLTMRDTYKWHRTSIQRQIVVLITQTSSVQSKLWAHMKISVRVLSLTPGQWPRGTLKTVRHVLGLGLGSKPLVLAWPWTLRP